MKLLRLKADGFGALRGEFSFDPGRLTLIVDDNERGKSTLIAAITAALYGLDDDKRAHRVMTPLDRWRPWDGGSYRVELDIEEDGTRYTIKRDFARGGVEVWNDKGQEVTAEFRAGKDLYPVGQKLLGLDIFEFEKCALVRQNDLEGVVPGEEKARRMSTLHARLENAADTRVGDTNATEALQVLATAAANYTSRELDSTLTVENAVKRLEMMTGLLESELKQLEHDYSQIQAPLERLSKLSDAEKDARAVLDTLDSERREALASEIRRQLEENRRHQAELEQLEDEVKSLSVAAEIPANAEADLRETVAKHEEALKSLESLETRRKEEQARERGALAAEAESLSIYSACEPDDADRAVALAGEMRRVGEEDQKLRTEVFGLRDALAGRGVEPERIQQLGGRFQRLSPDQQRLLRSQSELALAFQTEVADLERTRTESTDMLRRIDSLRTSRRLPGLVLLASGVSLGIAGGVFMAFKMGGPLGVVLLGGAAVLLLVGGGLLGNAAGARSDDRELALRQLSDAQRRLNQLRSQRAETEVGLSELSRSMGYRDPVELMRDWGEYAQLQEESGPVTRAQQQLGSLDTRKRSAVDEARGLLARAGGGEPTAERLEALAAGVRKLASIRQRMADTEKSWSWIDDEKRVAEASATGLKERAVKILAAAGLTYDAGQPWGPQVQQLAERAKSKSRLATLENELIPQAKRRVLPDKSRADLENQLEMLQSKGASAGASGARAQAEIDQESRTQREALEKVQQQRNDLRLEIDRTWSRYHTEQPEKAERLERAEMALARARRFRRAVDIARETISTVAQETHKRWADHLNTRVAELLAGVGAVVEQVRFGDDLDFSVTVTGQQMARGRAVQTLSAGARDQLYLAVRLAVSEYLSRGKAPLPMLIDDAFASSDDTRAKLGMKLLIEHFAQQHQVLVVTCHRGRHQTLAEADRALYAERVQWLDLAAARPAAAKS